MSTATHIKGVALDIEAPAVRRFLVTHPTEYETSDETGTSHSVQGEDYVLLEITEDGDGLPFKEFAGPFSDPEEAVYWLRRHVTSFDISVRS